MNNSNSVIREELIDLPSSLETIVLNYVNEIIVAQCYKKVLSQMKKRREKALLFHKASMATFDATWPRIRLEVCQDYYEMITYFNSELSVPEILCNFH
jgi:hypothetical protein